MLGEEGPLLSVCVEPCVCLAKCECVYAVLGSNNEMSTCLKKKLKGLHEPLVLYVKNAGFLFKVSLRHPSPHSPVVSIILSILLIMF